MFADSDDSPVAKEKAREAFNEGQTHLQNDRFVDAIDAFERAYQASNDALIMGQIAIAYERAGDFEAALKAIQIYRQALPESDREFVDDIIQRYRAAVKEGQSRPLKRMPVPAAKASKEAAESGAKRSKPYASEPAATAPTTTAEEAPKHLPPPAEATTTAPSDIIEDTRSRETFVGTWIAAGSAAAFGLAAAVMGISASTAFDSLDQTCGQVGGCPDEEVKTVETRAMVTDILLGLTAASAISAIILYFVEREPDEVKGASSEATRRDSMQDRKSQLSKRRGSSTNDGIDVSLMPLIGMRQVAVAARFRY